MQIKKQGDGFLIKKKNVDTKVSITHKSKKIKKIENKHGKWDLRTNCAEKHKMCKN